MTHRLNLDKWIFEQKYVADHELLKMLGQTPEDSSQRCKRILHDLSNIDILDCATLPSVTCLAFYGENEVIGNCIIDVCEKPAIVSIHLRKATIENVKLNCRLLEGNTISTEYRGVWQNCNTGKLMEKDIHLLLGEILRGMVFHECDTIFFRDYKHDSLWMLIANS